MANLHRETAKIYTFPARGRFAANARHDELFGVATDLASSQMVLGSSWYHDEAIQDAERTRKN